MEGRVRRQSGDGRMGRSSSWCSTFPRRATPESQLQLQPILTVFLSTIPQLQDGAGQLPLANRVRPWTARVRVRQGQLPSAVGHRTCPRLTCPLPSDTERVPMYLSTATGNQRCHGHTQPPNPVQSQSATNQLPAGPLVEMELDRVAIDGVAIDLPGDCARSEADGPRQTRGARRFSPGRAIRVWLWDGSTDQTASCRWPQRPAARPIPSSAQARR